MFLRKPSVMWALSTGIALSAMLVLGMGAPAEASTMHLGINQPYYFYPDAYSNCYVGIENGEYIYTAFAKMMLFSGSCIAGDAEVAVAGVTNNHLETGPVTLLTTFDSWFQSNLYYYSIVGAQFLICDYDAPACDVWDTTVF